MIVAFERHVKTRMRHGAAMRRPRRARSHLGAA